MNKIRYCLDSNIFITLKNGPYGFDFAPFFWRWLEDAFKNKLVYSSSFVYKELREGTDELAKWVKSIYSLEHFVEPSTKVQQSYQKIADFVMANFERHQADVFLKKADAWLIAQCEVDKSFLVTLETEVINAAKKVKIPNVCNVFEVKCKKIWELFREQGVRFNPTSSSI